MRELIEAFKALSDETRLRILNLLSERECCVCEVMQVLGISQTRASRNLGILYNAGFLNMRKAGLWSHYSIKDAGAKEFPVALLGSLKTALAGSTQARADLEQLKRSRRVGPGCQKLLKTVIFVCIHNSGRSQMAEAFFNQMARGRARAYSAGTQPADKVNPVVVEAMREVGIDISNNRPKALTPEMVEQADKVVTMGCGSEGVCPATLVETEDWGLDDPQGKPPDKVREIRDEIRARVEKMLGEMNR